jgi:RNA polymerase sigma-70 factor (ECF subfamily)
MSNDYSCQTDEFLAQESAQGALDAFDELVRRYQQRIYGFVVQTVSNSTDAREVTQDVFLRAFTAIGQFRPERVFSVWLFGIARNRIVDYFRSRKPVADETPLESRDYDDPAELMARREDRTQIWALARQSLPQLQFQALWLRYVEDMDVAEIAAVLGKTKTYVKVMLFRARLILADEFGPALRAKVEGNPLSPGQETSLAVSRGRLNPQVLT